MEYYPATLQQKMHEDFVKSNVFKIYWEILIGVMLFHKIGYAHSDIKASNILLTSEGEARIGDYGLVGPAKRISGQGTRAYAAPEVFSNLQLAFTVDY
jgi:serine/threonine protein kinase